MMDVSRHASQVPSHAGAETAPAALAHLDHIGYGVTVRGLFWISNLIAQRLAIAAAIPQAQSLST
jgi:hypothetical protein